MNVPAAVAAPVSSHAHHGLYVLIRTSISIVGKAEPSWGSSCNSLAKVMATLRSAKCGCEVTDVAVVITV